MLVRGVVKLPTGIPPERIVVVAYPTKEIDNLLAPMLNTGALAQNGRFAFDLAVGEYVLQLVDAETGIGFHTETRPRTIARGGPELAIEPEIHWLEIALRAEADDGESTPCFALNGIRVRPPAPREPCHAVLSARASPAGPTRRATIPLEPSCFVGAADVRLRWLVPPGRIKLEGLQDWGRPASMRNATVVESTTVDVQDDLHTVSWSVPTSSVGLDGK